jgi:hypothetical protein
MLTPEDIEFMRQTRVEIVSNRQSNINIVYEDGAVIDPITGEPLGGGITRRPALAVVTEVSSQAADRYLVNGIEVEKGDIRFSVAIEDVADIYDKLTTVEYDGKTYEIIAKDKKGIGVRNRVEVVGRLKS